MACGRCSCVSSRAPADEADGMQPPAEVPQQLPIPVVAVVRVSRHRRRVGVRILARRDGRSAPSGRRRCVARFGSPEQVEDSDLEIRTPCRRLPQRPGTGRRCGSTTALISPAIWCWRGTRSCDRGCGGHSTSLRGADLQPFKVDDGVSGLAAQRDAWVMTYGHRLAWEARGRRVAESGELGECRRARGPTREG